MQNSCFDSLSSFIEIGFVPKQCLEALKSMPNVETAANFLMEQADTPHPSTEQSGGSYSSQEGTDTDERSGVESEDDD